ncbi:MAG TPA: SgcJ/EcaC family oxidoreductase [Acidobacteria bacterium]|nr:SgcJ/EcaC family oxidoreductase [Acidobacteriota bacterium]
MKTNRKLIASAALAALLLVPACREKGDPKADLAAVSGVLEQVASAMKAGDVDAIMGLYEDDPAPVGFFIGGEMTGKQAIRQGWEQFFARNKVVSIDFTDVHNKLDRHLAVTYCLWKLVVESDGVEREMNGRLTSVLGKHEGKWYIHHDHISIPFAAPTLPAAAEQEQ